MRKLYILVGAVIFLFSFNVMKGFAQDSILITDFGIAPGEGRDVVPAIKEALKVCAGKKNPVLVFPEGRYDFFRDPGRPFTVGILLNGLRNLSIEGGGSDFIFHGNMQIASIFNCANITLRNFSIDWDQPYIFQGSYVASTDQYIDIWFDPDQYPYVIEDSMFYLSGEGWKARPNGEQYNLYDKKTGEILYMTQDGNNRSVFSGKAVEIGPGTVRFFGRTVIKPEPGTITTLMAGEYISTGISIIESRNITLEQITVYHALGHGVAGVRSENIRLKDVRTVFNEKKGRVFSTIGKAFYFNNCRGMINVQDCTNAGTGGEFIDIHGQYMKIDSILNDRTVISSQGRDIRPGEEMWFVNPVISQRSEPRTIRFKQPILTGDRITAISVVFTNALPETIRQGDFMENKIWNPSVEIRNCRITKHNRSGGILVATPEKVIIEDNYFRTAGAAVHIKGDLEISYESGACTDVIIRNNTFEDCLTSYRPDSDNSEWGEGIISIAPSHRPENTGSEPYHKNIRIENNTFTVSAESIVFARSAAGLAFTGNDITRSRAYRSFPQQQPSFQLDGCREVTITGNHIDRKYKNRNIEIDHMPAKEVTAEGFKITDQ